ncbi:MAG: phosphoenolpyruvate--protein phosphotransferase [Candidatus Poribacteria bacterium]|nr:phosphoenolpyruvate--protein phosphotransferase [Candidatus Poribacteria bacterium]
MTFQSAECNPSVLTGLAASPGVVIGEVFRIHDRVDIPRQNIPVNGVPTEIHRFLHAVKQVKKDLREIRQRLHLDANRDGADIFKAHLMMLEDPTMVERVRDRIATIHVNAEAAVTDIGAEFVDVFSESKNPYFRERSVDLNDLVQQIVSVLMGEERLDLFNRENEVIVVAHNLTPSDTVLMRKTNVLAFVTEVGTRVSHTAILARSLGIPAVVGVGSDITKAQTGDTMVVDGTHGRVIMQPDKEQIFEYQIEREKYAKVEEDLSALRAIDLQTTDGKGVEIAANIEFLEEIELIQKFGGKGVGLYRTEYFYMDRDGLPSEEELFEDYRHMVEQVSPEAATIRTLDIGGEKLVPHLDIGSSMDSLMGLRSIRLCLKYPDIFMNQLRAILRASDYGNVKIMFPMISGLDELREAKWHFEKAQALLSTERIPFDPNVEIGAMIELPAAALSADLLAKEVDFFSIGTNDLIQYTIAIDRRNEETLPLYEPLHPAVLRLIRDVLRVAEEAGIEITVCGEMAGDPVLSVLLIGMGYEKLSMSPTVIPEIKKVLSSISLKDAEQLVDEIMKLSTAGEIETHIWRVAMDRFPELLNWV